MLKIIDVEIENFRSIIGPPIRLAAESYNVITGPNNSGKSNILRALNLFFNGVAAGATYNPDVDYPKSTSIGTKAQTKITVLLKYDPRKDAQIERAIGELEKQSKSKRMAGCLLRLRLMYTRRGSESWAFLGATGTKNVRSEEMAKLVRSVRNSIRFRYIPVGRDTAYDLKKELSEDLVRTVFNGWSGSVKARVEINKAIDNLLEKLRPKLEESGASITSSMREVFAEISKIDLTLPFSDLETMLPSLYAVVGDNYSTGLESKGSGIQTSTLLFFLKYLADNHPQRHNASTTFIWAIEEPESFLHPGRQRGISDILLKFSDEVQTFVTTHSPHFVKAKKNSKIFVINKDREDPFSSIIIGNDPMDARALLGITLSDAMFVQKFNVVVEGPSDALVFKTAWRMLFDADRLKTDPLDVNFIIGGGCKPSGYLFEALIEHADQNTMFVVLFDGDDAGNKESNGLIARILATKNKALKFNKDVFLLPTDLENMMSDRLSRVLSVDFPGQVSLQENTLGKIVSVVVPDHHKLKVAQKFCDLASLRDYLKHERALRKLDKLFSPEAINSESLA